LSSLLHRFDELGVGKYLRGSIANFTAGADLEFGVAAADVPSPN
jgi:hypothetical protein